MRRSDQVRLQPAKGLETSHSREVGPTHAVFGRHSKGSSARIPTSLSSESSVTRKPHEMAITPHPNRPSRDRHHATRVRPPRSSTVCSICVSPRTADADRSKRGGGIAARRSVSVQRLLSPASTAGSCLHCEILSSEKTAIPKTMIARGASPPGSAN